MDLGQRLRQARLEMGLSQRQLCQGIVTRNMLSQIEHGSANPSMDTLRRLAGRLGKPVSFFLEEAGTASPNQPVMAQAREAYQAGRYDDAQTALRNYAPPDPVFDQEFGILAMLNDLALAREALKAGQNLYAQSLLARADTRQSLYRTPALDRERLLLLAQAAPEDTVPLEAVLPSDDRELLLRGEAALLRGDAARSIALLDAAAIQDAPRWQLLRGKAAMAAGDFAHAAAYLTQAEAAFPAETIPLLEQCYRETEDYKQAYLYACKRRES